MHFDFLKLSVIVCIVSPQANGLFVPNFDLKYQSFYQLWCFFPFRVFFILRKCLYFVFGLTFCLWQDITFGKNGVIVGSSLPQKGSAQTWPTGACVQSSRWRKSSRSSSVLSTATCRQITPPTPFSKTKVSILGDVKWKWCTVLL